jgi:glycosyltransferase involved in cell wall biosynthesis
MTKKRNNAVHWVIFGEDSYRLAQSYDRVISYFNSKSALDAIEKSSAEEIILVNANLISNNLPAMPSESNAFDLIHNGPAYGSERAFETLLCASSNWFFLNPSSKKRCISWKATMDLCFIRPNTVRSLGGFDRAYQSPEASLMDFAYRLILVGGRVINDPDWWRPKNVNNTKSNIPLQDEFLFICRHLGKSAAIYSAIWECARDRHVFPVISELSNALKRFKQIPAPTPASIQKTRLVHQQKTKSVNNVSVIIPTLNRYEYLPSAIKSLLNQDFAPDEIIIVDQTPAKSRKPEIYEPFSRDKLKIIYLDKAGQSTARNEGLKIASSEWILFFDDDSIAPPDLISKHIAGIEHSGSYASTGISLAPWKDRNDIPRGLRHYQLTNVLDTGNCLINRSAILSVGGFDKVFDRGSGADHDLGVRLFVNGSEILLNPMAIRTHYKAETGGLREFGAWWRNKTTFLGPYPPPTQIYSIMKYYPSTYWIALIFLLFIKARKRHKVSEIIWLWLSSPWKILISLRQLKIMTSNF